MTALVSMGRIDYLNVWPVYYGFDTKGIPEGLCLHSAPPAVLNRMLAEGRLDISAISAFAYAKHHRDWLLVPDLGIGCDGRVMSVLLVSHFPFEALNGKTLALSLESASATHLLRFLLADEGLSCTFMEKPVRHPKDLDSMAGGLVIGDAALSPAWALHFPFVYDLASLWKERTHHPFVFGLWALRRAALEEKPEALKKALQHLLLSRQQGEQAMDTICLRAVREKGLAPETAKAYFETLHYTLPASHQAGLAFYFACMEKMGFIDAAPALDFADPEDPLKERGTILQAS